MATHAYEAIVEKVAEGASDTLPSLMPRDLSLGAPLVPAKGNTVKIVAGVRRSGKTYRLYQEMSRLLDQGTPRSHMLYFNFDDERLRPYATEELDEMLNAYLRIRPEARAEGCNLFLDEIQEVPEWGAFLRRVVDSWNATIYVTGLSSRMLSSEMPSEFRGRALTYELFPMSFSEYCRYHGVRIPVNPAMVTVDERAALRNALDAYLLRGGFIAAQDISRQEAFQLLQGYVAQTVSQDVCERHGIQNARAARAFVSRCLASSGRELSISKASAALKSQGASVARETLSDLLGYYEESYLVFQVRELSRKLAENTRSVSKVYAVDPGLCVAYSPAASRDVGQRLETAVFDALRRECGFLRKDAISRAFIDEGSRRHEVDFVVGDALLGEKLKLIQVCLSLAEPATRTRELAALAAAMRKLDWDEAFVVTMDEREDVSLPEGNVHVVPAWEWLLR